MNEDFLKKVMDMIEMIEHNAVRMDNGIWKTLFNDEGMAVMKSVIKEYKDEL